MAPPRVLIVATFPGLADRCAELLHERDELRVYRLTDPRAAQAWAQRERVDLLVIELPLSPDAEALTRLARQQNERLAVLGLCCTRAPEEDLSHDAVIAGCDEILLLPFEPTSFTQTVVRLLETWLPSGSRTVTSGIPQPPELAGSSEAIQKLHEMIERLGPLEVEVWIQGNYGSPKAEVARALHAQDPSRTGPFVTADCRIESSGLQLFGDTLAIARTRWERLLRAAAGGALFLDHIECLPAQHQSILQMLLGEPDQRSAEPAPLRLLSSSQINLEDALEAGTFRRDLFYRLSSVRLVVPPLGQRPEDLPELSHALLQRISRRKGRPELRLSKDALDLLARHGWPGDVAELEHVLECTCELTDEGLLGVEALPAAFRQIGAVPPTRSTPQAPRDSN
ncbi:MAG: sigma 54-interacting transcriptional regulator [Planctomycetota bacterium]